MSDSLRVLLVQPCIGQDVKECQERITSLIKPYEQDDIDILCFPERWLPIKLNPDISCNYERERGRSYEFMSAVAKDMNSWVISGGIWEKRGAEENPFITTYIFNEGGQEVGRQDKIHLYKYEKKFFTPGREVVLFRHGDWVFSVLICFDLTFWETPRIAVEGGADVIFTPTMINERGMENWYIYTRARALENRVPVVGCNTCGKIFERKFPGGGTVVQFQESKELSPAVLDVGLLERDRSLSRLFNVNVLFPRTLREERLGEAVKKELIKLKRV